MAKTNLGLVEHAKMALNENWGYCLGAFGNVLTSTFLNQKLTQGSGVGTYNTKHKAYLQKFMNKRVSDCIGLVKSYLWWNGGNIKYNSAQDRNTGMAYNAAKEKGVLKTMPEIPGLILYMQGHVGVYIGNGEFIECAGAPTGMRKGKISNGVVTSGSRFTHWFKDIEINYTQTTQTLAKSDNKVKIRYKGKNMEVEGVFKDDKNYVGIRELLEKMGYTVDWEQSTQTVVIK